MVWRDQLKWCDYKKTCSIAGSTFFDTMMHLPKVRQGTKGRMYSNGTYRKSYILFSISCTIESKVLYVWYGKEEGGLAEMRTGRFCPIQAFARLVHIVPSVNIPAILPCDGGDVIRLRDDACFLSTYMYIVSGWPSRFPIHAVSTILRCVLCHCPKM